MKVVILLLEEYIGYSKYKGCSDEVAPMSGYGVWAKIDKSERNCELHAHV